MRMPVGAWALVAGCATGFAAVHIALDRACSRHFECDASHPTLSMTLRHGDVRRNVVPMLLASSVCLLLADCALWATCCSDQRGGGLITTHAALLVAQHRTKLRADQTVELRPVRLQCRDGGRHEARLRVALRRVLRKRHVAPGQAERRLGRRGVAQPSGRRAARSPLAFHLPCS